MKRRFPFAAFLLVLSAVLSASCLGADFYTLRTGSMRLVYYSRDHAFIVPHLVRSFQNSLSFHSRLFRYELSEEVLLFLQDYDDYGYAGATSLPHNYMILGIEPYEYTYETAPTNERINWVISHELMHVVASDQAAPADRMFRTLFQGKVFPTDDDPESMLYTYLTSPRKYSPRWYHEGIAVFMETWMSGGIGRAQNGWDEMVFRTMVRDSAYFYDFVGLESEGTTVDFQIGANSYLYGTRFVSYLARRYGPERVLEWFMRSDTSSGSYTAQFARIFREDIDDEWGRWVEWEQAWQRANLDSIRQYPLTAMRDIHPEPLGAVSRAHYDPARRMIYLGINIPGTIAHLTALRVDDGTMTPLCDVPTPSLYNVTSTAFDPATHTLFFTTKNGKGWRDLNAVDVESGEVRTLLKEARIGDLAFNRADSSLWGIQHHNGISHIVRIPTPYSAWQEVLPLRYGVDIYDPDIAPDGSALVASMMEINGRQRLIRIPIDSLMAGLADYEVLYEFKDTAPLNFVYSPDGRFLYGSTYQTGVANAVRYEFSTHSMEWLSNVETGLFRPLAISEDSLLVFRYTAKGFVPTVIGVRSLTDVSAVRYLGASIAEENPVVQGWKLPPPSPSRINVDSLTVSSGAYEGLGALGLSSLYPVVQGYKSSVAGGVRLDFLDPLLLHALDVTALYTPNPSFRPEERFHGTLRYQYANWKLTGNYNGADFYDLFGPTKRSRKGYSLTVGYGDYLVDDRPVTLQYSVKVGGYLNLERLPAFQNIATSANDFMTFNADLRYARLLRSMGAVDYEKGMDAMLGTFAYYARTTVFPALYGTCDWGLPMFRDHSSLWVRTGAGYGFGDPNEPFSNFYFGGFGNNWIDHAEVRQYREFSSFPGVELNAIGGTDFVKGMLEWDPPPLRFRRLGFPALYCTWARLAVFAGGLMTNLTSSSERAKAVDLGVQLDLKLVIFSNLSSTLSAGYARAWVEQATPTGEFMISLKIL